MIQYIRFVYYTLKITYLICRLKLLKTDITCTIFDNMIVYSVIKNGEYVFQESLSRLEPYNISEMLGRSLKLITHLKKEK